ncbi:hypothetical protein FOS14_14030 [Skermania sp. ID1734]|uniref:hypothetical protein n=1 Tax=Skermania sp. ID1734 TaxID=2597516 RepID=UPI001180C557|nr:hypothetical protein [Skermania sp. ID1734]TSD98105.1 hypothetical protein FOS14_14030 [Skermania sp. ID1734]
MAITRGDRFPLQINGKTIDYEIKTIRYGPIAYVEAEPVYGGGKRIAMGLTQLENCIVRAQHAET